TFPSFGEYDLKSDGCKKWYCEKLRYHCPIRKTDGWFLVDDYEVFKIVKK
ncbi:14570_t:CDS:1, partial [Racocetra fulgida]